MRKFLASILATTMALELSAMPMALAVDTALSTGEVDTGLAEGTAISQQTLSSQSWTIQGTTVPLAAYPSGSASYGSNQCHAFAQLVHKTIWKYTHNSSAGTDDDMLRELSASQQLITAANTKAFFTAAAPGSVIRIQQNGTFASNDSNYGHSMILLGTTADKCWIYDSTNTSIKVKDYTWSEFVSSFTSDSWLNQTHFKYIKYENATAYTPDGSSSGGTTPTPSMSVSTGGVDDITETNAVLNGTITGVSSDGGFYYGTSKTTVENRTSEYISFGSSTKTSRPMTCNMNSEAKLTLKAGTTYYYMTYGKDSSGNLLCGEVKSFKTSGTDVTTPSITVATGSASSITEHNAVISGTITGATSDAGFYYSSLSTAVAFGSSDSISFGASTNTSRSITCDLSKETEFTMNPDTTYYYKTYGKDTNGNLVYGEVKSFTTAKESVNEDPTDGTKYTISGTNVNYPSQGQIAKFYQDYGIATALTASNVYTSAPSAKSPYSSGVLSDTTQTHALNTLNYIRYIAGIDYNVVTTSQLITLAQDAALVNAANGNISHTPVQPNGMSDDLYDSGYEGSTSNLAASSNVKPISLMITDQWLEDGSVSNISAVGHRRWIINPTMDATGFGVVSGLSYTNYGTTGTMYTFSRNNTSASSTTGVMWPAPNTPTHLFGSDYPWSFSVGSQISSATVTLTRLNDGKVWNFSSSDTNTSGKYFNINNTNYGQTGCIIFRPDPKDISYSPGDVFHVELKGDVTASYCVSFFDVTSTTETTGNLTPSATPAYYVYQPEEKSAYTLSFQTNGGSAISSQTVEEGSKGTKPSDPTKTGYTFSGWYSNSALTTPYDFSTALSGNTTLYAKWTEQASTEPTPTTYTVTFNPNGGTVSTTTSTTNSTTGTLSSLPTPTKTGYIFDGWYDAQTGGNKITTSTVFSKDSTIYAQWTKEDTSEPTPTTYTVTFNPNGGTVSTTTSTTNSTTGTLSSLPIPSKTSYTFDGWYDAQTGGNKITTSTVFSKDTTIYAQWTAIETDTTTEVGIKLNSVDVSENGALAVNYSYKGELTNYGISVATSEEDAINQKGYAQGLGESKIVTGLWVTETYNCTMSFLAYPDPSQTLYVAVYGVDTEGNELISSVLTLQREVSATDYVIAFDSVGGSATPSQTTDTNGKLTSLFTPTRTGYTFSGWFTASTGGTKVTTSTVFNENTTVYAQWTSDTDETTKEAPFTITFSPMGGTVSDSTKDTSTSGTLSSLPTVTRDNYEFQGWYTLSAGGTQISTSTVFAEDVTVFAQWKRVVEDEDDGDTDSGDVEDEITDNTSIFSGLGTSSTNGTAVFSKNTPKMSEKVYMNVTLPSNHAIDSITMFDESGNLVKFYRDMSNDSYYFYQPDSFVTVDIVTRNVTLFPHRSTFTDVQTSEWYEQYVTYITDKGVMSSTSSTFSPESHTDRGTIAQALLDLSNESAEAHGTSATSFRDLSDSDYWNAVTWCTNRGIMSGYDSSTFAPNDLLTREQFAASLSTFAKSMGIPNVASTYQLDRFHDTSEISLWATSSVAWCVENGLLAGFDGYLKPQDTLSRAELSTMLSTFHKKFLA